MKLALDTYQQHRLAEACKPIARDLGQPYLVGTALYGPKPYRDVDLRVILGDDEFDAIFGGREGLWSLLCFVLTHYLRDVTGLPIDFQVQRQTEANERYARPRSAIAIHASFAGGGDATRFAAPEQGEAT